jgi:polar amino acid transport system substrate-binding protein
MKRILLLSLLGLAASLAASSARAQATPAPAPTPPPTSAPALAPAPAAAPAPAPGEASEVVFAPAAPPAVPDDVLARIRRRGVLKAGISNIMPWSMRDKDGQLIGFEVDVIEKLAADLGVKAEFIPVPPEHAIADLLAGRFDVAFNRMSITPQRALLVGFSNPVVVSSVELVVNKQKTGARKSLADFNSPDVTIGVRKGTGTAGLVRKTFPKARFQEFEDDEERFEAVRTGKVTATVALTPMTGVLSARYPEIASPLAAPLTKRAQAFAVRPGDSDFLVFLNAWITYETLEGWFAARLEYWFKDLGWTTRM